MTRERLVVRRSDQDSVEVAQTLSTANASPSIALPVVSIAFEMS